jgi:hypothetical protein
MRVSVANFVILFDQRYFFQAKIAVATTNAVTTKVHNLCVYSMITGVVKVGIIWPLQSGQSGQANSEPVEVTTPPRTISMYTEAEVIKEAH